MVYKKQVIVNAPYGIHSHTATDFLARAHEFSSFIFVEKNGNEARANAKSILSLLSLGVVNGNSITIIADGDDAEEAVTKLCELVEKGFDKT